VLPIPSLKLDHAASNKRFSTGVEALDGMLGGKGVYLGSSVLISGSAGTGKSAISVSFVNGACKRGERCLIFAYEESPQQLLRNMRSLGINLEPWVKKGLLQIHSSRPTLYGLEHHLLMMHDTVLEFRPALVVVDPISNLSSEHDSDSVTPTLMRLIDFLKQKNITTVFTSLTHSNNAIESSQAGISSLMDTWVLLRNAETNGKRMRTMFVLKSRGMAHSNEVHEFVMSGKGFSLVNTGTAPAKKAAK
jgi:circadian clock protein KaiC